MAKVPKKDQATTKMGWVAAIGVVLGSVGALIDNNPATVFDMGGVVQAVGVLLAATGIIRLGVRAASTDGK